jgi:hypothetical protein
LTDDEDSEIPDDRKKLRVLKTEEKKAKKYTGQTESKAHDVDRKAPRKLHCNEVQRQTFKEFEGIEIKAQVKYLGMIVCPTVAETVKAVCHQVTKYSSYVKAKCATGTFGLDKSIRSAYCKSLILCFLPVLVAIGAMGLNEVNKVVAAIGKSMEGHAQNTDHKVYLNLEEGGPKGTPFQVMAAAKKLKAIIASHLIVPSAHSVAKAEEVTERLLEKWAPIKNPVTPEERKAAKDQEERVKAYNAKRQSNILSHEEKIFAGLLATGRIAFSYHAVAVCNEHKCLIDHHHLEVCHLLSANGCQPYEWLWVLKDQEKDLYDHEKEVVEQVVQGVKTLYAKVTTLQLTEHITIHEYRTPGEHADKLEELKKHAMQATAEGLTNCHNEQKDINRRIANLRKAQASANAAQMK